MLQKFTIAAAQALLAAMYLFTATQAVASEMIYAPVNPSFGGNPNNGPVLLSTAQAQNSFTAVAQSPIEVFNLSLQRSILTRLASQTLNTLFGSNNKLTVGTYESELYTVQVSNDGIDTLTITTTDKISGAKSTFVVSNGTF